MVKKIVGAVQDDRAGKRRSDVGGTNSGDNVDSKQVEAAQLTANGQYMPNDARTATK